MSAYSELPLAGIRAIEIEHGVAHYAGKLLSDLGAEVIKAEPAGGSPSRAAEPVVAGRSVPFDYYNTGKRSVALELDSESGRAELRALISAADLVVDDLSDSELQELGLSDETLGSLRPGIVHLSVTPFGASGPWRERLGSDLVSLAGGGVTASTGYDSVDGEPGEPITPTGGHAAHFGGVLAATYAVAALLAPRTEGVLRLDVSVHDVIAVSTEIAVSLWEFGKQTVVRHTGRHAAADLHTPEWQFRCADGRYISAITLYMNNRRFAAIKEWFAEDGLAHDLEDEKFATDKGRVENMHEIVAVMRSFFGGHDSDWLFSEAQRRQLPWAKVQLPQDLVDDPQLRARDFFTSVALPDGRLQEIPGHAWVGLPTIFDVPEQRMRAPELGEDAEILAVQKRS
ncbi:CaiB/BaiF CoA transferase family protein [Gryllotalpicola koreensis]|uniref:CaiB/BaiF CoA-transferase family protein n=1 Tax=Gryllotalpicola koreensis TaxID=993086 RepID=A0ABP7ZUH3_9MICO